MHRVLEKNWKALGLIGVIMGVGFTAATYMTQFKVADEAEEDHAELQDATNEVDGKVEAIDEAVKGIELRNVRIEVVQQQISDQLTLISEQTKRGRSRDPEAVEKLEQKIEIRGAALKKSYAKDPVINAKSHKLNDDNPLAGLEGL